MAKINRFNGDVQAFGSNSEAGEFYTFGSTIDTSRDFDNLLNSEFLRGWGVIGPSEVPPLEWFNAIGFTATQFASYLHQMGVAEWNSLQEYPTEGGLVVHNGKVWKRGSSWALGDEPEVSNNWLLILDTESVGDSIYVENRFKGNQNWNVAGSSGDPLPDGTPRTYTVGSEVVADVEVITNDAEQITYTSGVINSGNNTGILRRRYAKDAAGLITKTSQHAGIKLPDGSQLQALVDDIATNGVRITEDGSDVVVDVDLSVITGGFLFFGLSNERGIWASVNDSESKSVLHNHYLALRTVQDVSGSRVSGVTYTNLTPTDIELQIWFTGSVGNEVSADLSVDGITVGNIRHVAGPNSPIGTITTTVPQGKDYVCNSAFITSWSELRV